MVWDTTAHSAGSIGPRKTTKLHGERLVGKDKTQLAGIFSIQAEKQESQQPTRLRELLGKYANVFQEGLGTVKGVYAKIHTKENAQAKYCKARSPPYGLQLPIEKELERLQKEGTIEPVKFSDWEAPIVPTVKPNKTIRICGDYKLTANQAFRLENYLIPKTEDLLAMLGGGEKFTKLDMSQAYQQLPLEEGSHEYTMVNTHKGLFRYHRLHYGVSSAPGIFQHTMDNLHARTPISAGASQRYFGLRN